MDATILAGKPTLLVDTLDELCRTRETLSAVTLTLDLVNRGRLEEWGDPLSLVVSIIEELADAGLVKFRLRREWSQIPLNIKVTPDGYVAAGYTHRVPAVGSGAAKHVPIRPAEAMEWRILPSHTFGGPIERSTLSEHLAKYPDHVSIHPSVWECGPYIGDNDMVTATANWAEMIDKVRDAIQTIEAEGREPSFTAVQAQLGLSAEPTHRWLNRAKDAGVVEQHGEPGKRGATWRLTGTRDAENEPAVIATKVVEQKPVSARSTIMGILGERDKVDDAVSLMRIMVAKDPRWGTLGTHSLHHQLESMRKQGMVRFDEDRRGNNRTLINIRLAKPSVSDGNGKIETIIPVPAAVVEDAGRFDKAVSDVIEGRYPLLDSLRARRAESDRLRARADAYLAAASALDGVDQAESDRLMSEATKIAEGSSFSSTEIEYLRYSDAEETERERIKEWRRMARLADLYLNIVICPKCRLPKADGFICPCGYDGSEETK